DSHEVRQRNVSLLKGITGLGEVLRNKDATSTRGDQAVIRRIDRIRITCRLAIIANREDLSFHNLHQRTVHLRDELRDKSRRVITVLLELVSDVSSTRLVLIDREGEITSR